MSKLLRTLTNLWVSKIFDIGKTSVFNFFTIWGLVIQMLYYLGYLRQYQFSILLLLIIISIAGIILTYVHPKKYVIPVINFEIKNKKYVRFFDLFGHHIPLSFFIYNYNKNIPKDNLLFLFTISFVYLLINNPFKIYRFY
jgi:hypothetical protein